MSIGWLLAVLLLFNVGHSLAAPQPDDRQKFCINKVALDPSMTCQQVADFCRTSLERLFRLNPYFQNGAVCQGPLDRSVTVCCEFDGANTQSASSTISLTADNGMGDICARECRTEDKAPVCGSDGQTYRNKCFLEVESCRNPFKELYVFANTECKPDMWKSCLEVCSANVQPVCASNNVTYMNDCYLRRAACIHPDDNIVKVSDGACFSTSRKPQTTEGVFAAGVVVGGVVGSEVGTKFASCFAVSGARCIFPFDYRGSTYNRCTTEDYPFRWCATKVVNENYDRYNPKDLNMVEWGKCGFGC